MVQQLPEHLYSDVVALWQRTGLTRPWNDPTADLHRAMTGPVDGNRPEDERPARPGPVAQG